MRTNPQFSEPTLPLHSISSNMRLSYVPNPPPCKSPEETAILDRILQRRGLSGLNELDRTQFHAPLIADGFNAYFKALRTQNGLPPQVRELCFIRVAALLGAWYEWEIHLPIAREAGISEDSVIELKRGDAGPIRGLDETSQAVVDLVDEMTLRTAVDEAVYDRVRQYFDEKEMVEMVNSIAGFNGLSKLVVALDIGEKN
jgi:alkylhydroperoxidase family enzyme